MLESKHLFIYRGVPVVDAGARDTEGLCRGLCLWKSEHHEKKAKDWVMKNKQIRKWLSIYSTAVLASIKILPCCSWASWCWRTRCSRNVSRDNNLACQAHGRVRIDILTIRNYMLGQIANSEQTGDAVCAVRKWQLIVKKTSYLHVYLILPKRGIFKIILCLAKEPVHNDKGPALSGVGANDWQAMTASFWVHSEFSIEFFSL